ncbi:MAG: hypothetical protein ACM3WT_07555 [Bacillota bacterium]
MSSRRREEDYCGGRGRSLRNQVLLQSLALLVQGMAGTLITMLILTGLTRLMGLIGERRDQE